MQLGAVLKDLTDLLACGVIEAFIIPMVFVMHHSVGTLTKRILLI